MTKASCNCQKQLANGPPFKKPQSASLRNLGSDSDGYYVGNMFLCNVCGRHWFRGESHTESEFTYFWEPLGD